MSVVRSRFFSIASVCLLCPALVPAADWTQFRGPDGSGVSLDRGLPTTWSDSDNLKWKTPLPGPGSSSPIILGDRVYVTCFSGADEDSGDVSQLKRHLLCLDCESGEVVWNATVDAKVTDDPYRGMMKEHGYASQTPITDGERIYVFFGKSGVFAFDLKGHEVWQASVGTESSRMRWGSGSSPILHDNLLIINASDESQSLRALDKRNGKEVWKTEANLLESVYATPALLKTKESVELVVPAAGEVWGLNPENGKLRWYAETNASGQISPTPVAHEGVVYCLGGRGGGGIAIRGGGKNDVTASHVVWKNRDGSNVPSPVLYEGHLYWLDERGIAHCVNAKNGESVFTKRMAAENAESDERTPSRDRGREPAAGGRGDSRPGPGSSGFGRGGLGGRGGGSGGGGFGGGSSVYASLVAADGKLFGVTRRGGTYVIAAKPDFELLALNQFDSDDSQFNATPSVSDGQLFLRSDRFIYCIASE